jgi:anaerobic selenocysteine-containing dehydrogenase
MTPTASFADIVLPVATAWEREGLRVGFDSSQDGLSLVQLRPALVKPRGEARADIDIAFAFATRLGLGNHFWQGDVDAAYRHLLAPSGVTLDALRRAPGALRVALTPRFAKYRETGFATPTRKLEIYSEALLAHGQSPLPIYVEPAMSPFSRPDLATRFPLVLTSGKSPQFCHSQHRNIAKLRRIAPDPIDRPDQRLGTAPLLPVRDHPPRERLTAPHRPLATKAQRRTLSVACRILAM